MEGPFVGDSSLARKPLIGDSLVGKPFTFSDLACFYPWCQVGFFGWQKLCRDEGSVKFCPCMLIHFPIRLGRQIEEEHKRAFLEV